MNMTSKFSKQTNIPSHIPPIIYLQSFKNSNIVHFTKQRQIFHKFYTPVDKVKRGRKFTLSGLKCVKTAAKTRRCADRTFCGTNNTNEHINKH